MRLFHLKPPYNFNVSTTSYLKITNSCLGGI
jgi:hypothetical protein